MLFVPTSLCSRRQDGKTSLILTFLVRAFGACDRVVRVFWRHMLKNISHHPSTAAFVRELVMLVAKKENDLMKYYTPIN